MTHRSPHVTSLFLKFQKYITDYDTGIKMMEIAMLA
jgi:hypothetical protein